MRKGSKHSETTKKTLSKRSAASWAHGCQSRVGCFKPGNKPWNAGLRGFRPSVETEFRAGEHVGKDHPSWKGGVQRIRNDCTHVWTGCNKRARRPVRVWCREHQRRRVPRGHVIYHIDGDRNNDSPDNLVCISRADLLKMNQNRSNSL